MWDHRLIWVGSFRLYVIRVLDSFLLFIFLFRPNFINIKLHIIWKVQAKINGKNSSRTFIWNLYYYWRGIEFGTVLLTEKKSRSYDSNIFKIAQICVQQTYSNWRGRLIREQNNYVLTTISQKIPFIINKNTCWFLRYTRFNIDNKIIFSNKRTKDLTVKFKGVNGSGRVILLLFF
jgi:hypothetical protein